MPDGYGVPTGVDGTVAWERVERALVEAIHYWVATVRPDGRPHLVPRWGVWTHDSFWYDGSPETVHAGNLRHNSAMTLHLESGEHVVVLEGTASPSAPLTGEIASMISDRFKVKYADRGYAPERDSWSGADAGGMVVFRPRKALAWFSFPDDVSRFRFDATG